MKQNIIIVALKAKKHKKERVGIFIYHKNFLTFFFV